MTDRKKRKRGSIVDGRYVHNKKLVGAVYFVLRLSVIAVLLFQIANRNYENVLLCVLTLILFMMPSVFERRLHIDLPDTLEIVILLFIYSAEILGEIRDYYISFPHWDLMLHTMNGFLCAAIGFALVDILNRTERVSLNLSPFFMAVVSFCFSMTIGVLWEFFEFAMDQLVLFDMQKDTVIHAISSVNLDPNHGTTAVVIKGIQDTILVLEDGSQVPLGLGGYLDVGVIDTMQDLFVNFIGAVIFSAVGFFYVKGRGKSRFAPRFIPRVVEEPPAQDAPPEPHEKRKNNPPCGPPYYRQTYKEVIEMTNQTTNPSIKCTVNSCTHHKDAHCTLNEIQVGCCQNNVGECKQTACNSFELGNHGTSCGCN